MRDAAVLAPDGERKVFPASDHHAFDYGLSAVIEFGLSRQRWSYNLDGIAAVGIATVEIMAPSAGAVSWVVMAVETAPELPAADSRVLLRAVVNLQNSSTGV